MYIVAYDIADARERNRVAKALADFGERVQKSVWTCGVDSSGCVELKRRLKRMKIASGVVHVLQARTDPWVTGDLDSMPEKPWAHCL